MLSWERHRYIRVLRRRLCVRGVRKCRVTEGASGPAHNSSPLAFLSFSFLFLHIIHHFCLVSSTALGPTTSFLPHFYIQPVVRTDGKRYFSVVSKHSLPEPSEFFFVAHTYAIFSSPSWRANLIKAESSFTAIWSKLLLSQIVSKFPKYVSKRLDACLKNFKNLQSLNFDANMELPRCNASLGAGGVSPHHITSCVGHLGVLFTISTLVTHMDICGTLWGCGNLGKTQ